MSKLVRRFVAPILLAMALAGGAATAASATITYPPEGGTWDHGWNVNRVWSNYLHQNICHGSTAVGQTTVSRTASAGNWSLADARVKLAGNKAYYRTSC
jgi:lactococcin 972 family bacteriocin